jgi:hypothetical protein
MNTQTIFQSIETLPYESLVVLNFLYDKPKGAELIIEEKEYRIDNIRDKVSANGNITRLIRVCRINKYNS